MTTEYHTGLDEVGFPSDFFNSFTMDEISRILHDDLPPYRRDHGSQGNTARNFVMTDNSRQNAGTQSMSSAKNVKKNKRTNEIAAERKRNTKAKNQGLLTFGDQFRIT